MEKKNFLTSGKGIGRKGRKEEFHTNQAELFRQIRDRKNLEILLVFKGIADTIGAHGRERAEERQIKGKAFNFF